jgi:hypothetical protein
MSGSQILFQILAAIGTALGIINGLYLFKSNRDAPTERRWNELNKWRDDVDARLDRDYSRLNSHSKYLQGRGKFEEMVMLSLRGLIDHSISNNGIDEMKKLSRMLVEYTASLGRTAAEDLGDE